MRYFTLFFALFAFVLTATAQQKGPMILFEKEVHDFGQMNEGDQKTYEFKITNVGDAPLVITNVKPSCGCTTPDWTKQAIAPGETGFIKAKYNSAGRPGRFHRSITVTTNQQGSEGTKVIYIKGDVTPASTGSQSPVRVPGQ